MADHLDETCSGADDADGRPDETCGEVDDADGQPAETCGEVDDADGHPAETCGGADDADGQPADGSREIVGVDDVTGDHATRIDDDDPGTDDDGPGTGDHPTRAAADRAPDRGHSTGDGALPPAVADRVERLTRNARHAVDPNEEAAYRDERSELLAEQGFEARIREEDTRDVLVMYPEEWIDEDGTVRTERIEDTDRAVERPLSGPGDPDEWAEVAAHNESIAETVRERYGDVHGDNADALATFMSNHYAKPIESATRAELEEFRTEFLVRNAWPTEEQLSVVDRSLEKTFEVTAVPDPRTSP